jgi:hypothetical protein
VKFPKALARKSKTYGAYYIQIFNYHGEDFVGNRDTHILRDRNIFLRRGSVNRLGKCAWTLNPGDFLRFGVFNSELDFDIFRDISGGIGLCWKHEVSCKVDM